MPAGPCVICGATNYALSMGGPSLCPSCDCGTPDPYMIPLLRREHDELTRRVKQLESAIRTHRSQKADDRCIEDDDRLYESLGDGIKCDRRVGDQCAMLENCKRFIQNRTEGGGWPTYAELDQQAGDLLKALQVLLEEASNFTVQDVNFMEPCFGHKGPALAEAAIAKATRTTD